MFNWEHPHSPQVDEILRHAEETALDLGQGYMGTEHLLMGMVLTDCTAGNVLRTLKVEEKKLSELIRRLIAPEGATVSGKPELTPKAEAILEAGAQIAVRNGQQTVGSDHLLLALARDEGCTAVRLLNTMEVNYEALIGELMGAMGRDAEVFRDFREGTAGGTQTLDRFSRDLTALAAAGRLDPVIGRTAELSRLLTILSRRTKNNPCLIGEPGVGKTAIVELLAQKIAADEVPASMRGRRVLALDLSGMVAGTKYRGEFEERIKRVITEAGGDRRIILFLDEIHTLIGAGGAEGSLDAANILKPALSRGEIQLIGATTVSEYRKHIEKDAALERRFQPVLVEEPGQQETVEILKGLRHHYEAHHGVRIEEEALEQAAALSARYVGDRFLPDKALDLIDEACARVQLSALKGRRGRKQDPEEELELAMEKALQEGRTEDLAKLRAEQAKKRKRARSSRREAEKPAVTGEDVAEVVSTWTKIPVRRLAEKESDRLRNLEKELHRRVVGQEEAVTAVARAVRRGRIGLKDPNRPVGSFLFLGPTGVGKTELCKALAEVVYGRESAMIRVDMSEYMEKHSVSRMIGSPPGYVGYEEGGQLAEKVRRNPWSVILFDEIEKAHPDVFNVLLQILDDGHVTDSQGRTIDFKQTILIMTSNAGAERIASPKRLGFAGKEDAAADHERMKSGVMEEVKRLFRPEFLNRIDETIVFHSLTKEDMKAIFTILLKQMNRSFRESHNLHLTVNAAARDWLIEKGYDPKYGARPLRRVMQSTVEDALADELLAGTIHDGDEVVLTLVQGRPKLRAKGRAAR